MLLLVESAARAQLPCDPETGDCQAPGPAAPPDAPAPPDASEAPCDPESGDCTPEAPVETTPALECDPETGECTLPTPAPEEAAPEPVPPPPSQPAAPVTAPTPEPAPAEVVATEEAQIPEQVATEAPPPPACDPLKEDCSCPANWGCWELLYTTKGTVLGGRVSLTYGDANTHKRVQTGFQTFYSTEHFATRKYLTLHALGFGSIGGGTAGTEGSLGLGLDVGFRGEVTEQSGPFVRLGMAGLLLGNSAFYVSYFEPMQERVGYQWLEGDTLFEVGATHGTIPVARFNPGRHVHRDLSRSNELGGYAAVRYAGFRVNATFMHILGDGRNDVELARSMICSYQLGIALCADALFARGRASQSGQSEMTNTLYMGLTVGLSP
jgi:hypothetical protein